MMRKVKFTAKDGDDGIRDGGAGWLVSVDGEQVAEVDSDDLDVGDKALNPLWQALNVSIEFDCE